MKSRAESFRQWLGERLKGTAWASEAMSDTQVERCAEVLGVAPSLLLEVRAEVKLERHSRGHPQPVLDRAERADRGGEFRRFYQFHLFMPEAVWHAWKEECEFLQVPGALLLRSLIQEYLVGTREPHPIKLWRWKGKAYRMGPNSARAKFLERATIPYGARRALRIRARNIGCCPTDVARALVLEVLEGLHRNVLLIEASMMYDDEARYLSGRTTSS